MPQPSGAPSGFPGTTTPFLTITTFQLAMMRCWTTSCELFHTNALRCIAHQNKLHASLLPDSASSPSSSSLTYRYSLLHGCLPPRKARQGLNRMMRYRSSGYHHPFSSTCLEFPICRFPQRNVGSWMQNTTDLG